jgi:hypothetical protein
MCVRQGRLTLLDMFYDVWTFIGYGFGPSEIVTSLMHASLMLLRRKQFLVFV